MVDGFNRKITYLRVSLTELCNLRCRYCMPEDGVCKKNHNEMLTQEELINFILVASKLGIKKVRLTGGEPLVKKDIIQIIKQIKEIDGIEEICLTTNGVLLKQYAKELKNAGLNRINISIDTLNEEKYKYITRVGSLKDSLDGIDAVLKEQFDKIKINTVLIGGFNDDEIIDLAKLTIDKPVDVRFIELMPMYDSGDFLENSFLPYTVVLDKLYKEFGKENIIEVPYEKGKTGVAKLYKIKNAKGNIGLISPVNDHFCAGCNRIRLTADGKIKPCLHSNEEILIKGLTKNEMEEKLKQAIMAKPEKHDILSYSSRSKAERNMNQIGG